MSAQVSVGEVMKRQFVLICFLLLSFFVASAHAEKWWKKWENHPNVPRITAKEVKDLMLAGKKTVFVYAGYKREEVICGSFYIPYTLVPPYADGSKVRMKIPRDYWIMCY